jgi:hypothetical protein
MPRILLLVPSTSYRARDFLTAARALEVEVVVGADHRHALAALCDGRYLDLDLDAPEHAASQIGAFAAGLPFDAVLGTDDASAIAAARAASTLGLRHNAPGAVEVARDKHRFREVTRAAGVPSPASRLVDLRELGRLAPDTFAYPCVVKPRSLCASRGVIRVDGPDALLATCRRVGAILRRCSGLAEPAHAHKLLVESYVPGAEVALEGLLDDGRLTVLALIDKPEPMAGPYFEETVLTTPSRLAPRTQAEVVEVVSRAARAIGLREGPVHAEARVNAEGVWIIELAPRTIGGLCSRALRFRGSETLETVVLRHALGLAPANCGPAEGASGVMMIPIARAGRLIGVAGLDAARHVEGIEDIIVGVAPGERLVPVPEGDRYLGFIFARAATPERTEQALRQAHAKLIVCIEDPQPARAPARPGPWVPFTHAAIGR